MSIARRRDELTGLACSRRLRHSVFEVQKSSTETQSRVAFLPEIIEQQVQRIANLRQDIWPQRCQAERL